MTKKGRVIPPPKAEAEPEEPRKPGMTYTFHWTRQEQIDNADRAGTLAEIMPPLEADEKPTPVEG